MKLSKYQEYWEKAKSEATHEKWVDPVRAYLNREVPLSDLKILFKADLLRDLSARWYGKRVELYYQSKGFFQENGVLNEYWSTHSTGYLEGPLEGLLDKYDLQKEYNIAKLDTSVECGHLESNISGA